MEYQNPYRGHRPRVEERNQRKEWCLAPGRKTVTVRLTYLCSPHHGCHHWWPRVRGRLQYCEVREPRHFSWLQPRAVCTPYATPPTRHLRLSHILRVQKSEDKIHEDFKEAKFHKVIADLSSLKAVREAAAEINALGEPIHVST